MGGADATPLKFKGAAIALFLAAVWASFALAGRPPDAGHGKGSSADTSTTTITTTTTVTVTVSTPRFVVLCHRTRSAAHPWVKIKVPTNAVFTHVTHGDALLAARGTCPSSGGAAGPNAHGH
jgi:hypothetical protein